MIKIERVNYILQMQDEGKTRHEIKDSLGYKNLDSMTKYMRKRGYKVENDRYVLSDDSSHQGENIEITQLSPYDDNSMTVGHPHNIKKAMIEIVEHKDDILDMIKWFKMRDDNSMTSIIEVVHTGIKIDLPESETTRTTIRINKTIWDEFDAFCEKYKEFNKQDLMGQALKEFMQKNTK